MRVKCQGEPMRMADAAKPFRHADLSPREEMSEYQRELTELEAWQQANTTWKTWPQSSEPKMQRMAELRKRIASIDYWINDSASTPQLVRTLSDLNLKNAAYWEGRR